MDSQTEEILVIAGQLNNLIDDARQRQRQAGLAPITSSAELVALMALQSKAHVAIPPPVGWPGWPAGLWLKGVSLLERLSHRSIAWMIGSLVTQQNQFNATVVRAVQSLLAEQAERWRLYQEWQTTSEARLAALSLEVERLQQAADEART